MKHTPGPWSMRDKPNESCFAIRGIALGSKYAIANVPYFDRQNSFIEARNYAQLIAATPYLLEALKDMIVATDFENPPKQGNAIYLDAVARPAALKAIKKAEANNE